MTERDTPWPAGTPCWVDLATPDVEAALRFYGELFGWHFAEAEGGYHVAELRDRAVAAIGPKQADEQPTVWTTYLASTDVDATAEKVTAAGGAVLLAPSDVGDSGRLAIAVDPTGGAFGVWQAGKHNGFALANENGTVVWNELVTRDYAAAKDFYADVFGYIYTEIGGGGFQYSTIEVGGNTVGGLGALPDDTPAGVPAHWRTYFVVADADASLSRAEGLGGRVLRPADDMPYGRWGDAADPQGASFALIRPGPGPS